MANINVLATRAAKEAGVPPRLFLALITRGERSYKGWQTSPSGAHGPAQLMPGTAAGLAKRYGIKTDDYYGNLLGGAYYLKEQLDHFGDKRKAVAAYNAGPGAVEHYGGVPPYPETERYVRNVLGASKAVKVPSAGGITVSPARALLAPPLPGLPSFPGMTPLTSQIFSGLGEIAMGTASPLETLTKLTSTLGPQIGAKAPAAVPAPSVPAPTKAPAAGGSWGGSYRPATTLARVGEKHGLTVTSEKRDRKMTSSGNTSDHWAGSKSAYAYDLGGTVAQMDAAARDLAARLGIKYSGGPLVVTKTTGGLRYQLLYRTNIGGNHYTHIHIGVRRIS